VSRKKKTQEKVKAVEVEVVAEPTPKKAPSPRKEAARVLVDSRAKAQEIIKPVSIALLEAHPELPDVETILGAFAEHYHGAEERREEARAAAEAAAQKAELEKKIASRKTVRPSWAPASPPPITSQGVRPQVAPPIAPPPEPEPEPELPPLAVAVEPEPPAIDVASEPSPIFVDDAPSIFETDDAPPPEDIFAALGQSKPRSDSEDFGFTSDYSDPFISVARPVEPAAAEPDERTSALPAFDDIVSAVSEEAAPTDRTTMIQAMPDDEEAAESAEPTEAAPEDSGRGSRKSRKSSQRRKR